MSNRRPYNFVGRALSMIGVYLCVAFGEPDRLLAGPAFTERAEFGARFTLSVAWSDFDNDGDMDLAVGNQQQGLGNTGSELYVNNGDGTFTGRNEFGQFGTFGLAWGDFNNDGDPDMAVANGGSQANQLYINNGDGTFTGQAQFGTGAAIGIAWADFDLDGDLDLAVGRGILGANQQNHLYVNNGNGTFTERDEFGTNQTDTVVWGDFDNDGDPDLAVGNGGFNSLQQNFLYVNNGDGTFTERAEFGTGDTATMDWGDYDNDGDLDLAVGNWENSDSYLYVNNGDGTFTEQLQFGARDTNTISWGDYDLDGDLDLAVGNGDFFNADQAYLYVNNGDGSFTEQVEFGLGSTDGVAWADFDADGDLDLAFGNEHSPQQNFLYINNLSASSWLSLHLIGHFHDHGSGHSNRDAVGAKVSVFEQAHLGDPVFLLGYREVSAHGGFASQNPLDPHFGLPGQTLVDVRIVWPGSGGTHITTDLTAVAVNQRLVVDEAPPITDIEEVVPDPLGGKNRAISFTAPSPVTATGSGGQRAIRVTLVDLQHPAPRNLPQFPPSDFTAFDTDLNGACVSGEYAGHHCHDDADCAGAPSGTCAVGAGCTAVGESNACARWVGPPQTFLESNDLPDRGSFRGARLQCTPYYRDWSVEGLVHVIAADIVPSSTYSVEVLPVACKGQENQCTTVSDPVTITTRRAGDVSAPFSPPDDSSQPNGVDIANVVNKFRSQIGAPMKAASLLQPSAADFESDVNSLDVAVTVQHFRFKPYALSGPCPCPATVPCNFTSCTSAAPCTTLYGAGALCIQTCSSGPNDGQPCIGDKNCNLCSGGSFNGLPCDPAAANPCPGGACPSQGLCPASGFCRDRCARCATSPDLLVASRFSNNVLRFNATTGAFVGVFASGNGMGNPNGIAYGPDGHLYVGLGDEPRVLRFHGSSGDFLGEFVGPGTPGGLSSCRAIAFAPDGNLYVNSASTDQVLKYDGATGAFLAIAAQGQGMDGPVGLTFGPDGNLYVGAALSNRVYVFDTGGQFLRSFNCGPENSNAVGVLFDKTGRLLVAQSVTNNVLAFDPLTGSCLGVAAQGGGLNVPIHMILTPNGKLLVGSFGNDRVIEYDVLSAQPIGTFIAAGAGGLDGVHNFAFMPGPPPGGQSKMFP